jgi:hypothetical protein
LAHVGFRRAQVGFVRAEPLNLAFQTLNFGLGIDEFHRVDAAQSGSKLLVLTLKLMVLPL